tara:strand:+ start:68 stop:460 length:393 start_codon:yes stop_codon:yes gene_type:complete
MKLKLGVLLCGIMILIFSCKSQNKELTTEFLIGKWSKYDGTTTENGITKNDFLPSSPIKYKFEKDGTINIGFETPDKMVWKINENNNLLIGTDKQFAEYTLKIETDTTLILSREHKGKIFSYYFRKGWAE